MMPAMTAARTRSLALGLTLLAALLLASTPLRAGLFDGAAGLLTSGNHHFVATAEATDVPESSGVIASRLEPDVYWTHNDSGNPPRVYAFRLSPADRARRVAKDLGYVQLRRAFNEDWEDIAYGPGGMIYLFDGGNNQPCNRQNKCIYRFREPRLEPNGRPIRIGVDSESIGFEYPDPKDPKLPAARDDDRYDAESLFVHPQTADMYIITKRNNQGVPRALVYKLAAADVRWNSRTVYVLKFIADLTLVVPAMATGADIDDSGRHVVVRDYLSAYEFTLAPGRPFDSIFSSSPQVVRLLGEPQGEAICYSRDGKELITTSEIEVLHRRQFPVYSSPPPSATSQPSVPASQRAAGAASKPGPVPSPERN
jgi:hypothetical protein